MTQKNTGWPRRTPKDNHVTFLNLYIDEVSIALVIRKSSRMMQRVKPSDLADGDMRAIGEPIIS